VNPAVCQPKPQVLNGVCGLSTKCQDGLYCAPVTPTSLTCRPRKIRGSNCTSDAECGASLYCTSTAGGTCDDVKTLNQSCSLGRPASQCGTGTFCDATIMNMTGSCVALKRMGDACSGGSIAECQTGFFCSSSGMGKCVGIGAANEPCQKQGSIRCQPGLYCADTGDPKIGVCTPKKSAGVACTGYEECFTNCESSVCVGCVAR
jgi:Dickkopf N-terminal cysteine-rich region